MSASRDVTVWLDFVSPYAWLALWRLPELARETGARFVPRPVVYAKLLEAHGLIGPVETTAKRRYTLLDVARTASALGAPLVGPPAHPFRSLAALRALALFAAEPCALELARALASAAWAEGRDLERWDVLADVVQRAGADARDLERRATAPGNKAALVASTAAALERGVFGVPTFELAGELFWGQDRLDALRDRLLGRSAPPDAALVERLVARPIGVRRPAPPGTASPTAS